MPRTLNVNVSSLPGSLKSITVTALERESVTQCTFDGRLVAADQRSSRVAAPRQEHRPVRAERHRLCIAVGRGVRDLANDRHALIRFALRSALSAFPRK